MLPLQAPLGIVPLRPVVPTLTPSLLMLCEAFYGSRIRLVRRKRTRSAWRRERVALVRANSLEGDPRARGFLECTIRITKRVHKPKSGLLKHNLAHTQLR